MAEFKIPRTRQWTAEQARVVLDEIQRRGVSVHRFATENGLGVERLYRWRRLLGRSRRSPGARAPRFAELTVRPAARAALIELELPGGIAVRIGGESRVEDAAGLLARLVAR